MHPMVWVGVVVIVLWALAWLAFRIAAAAVHLILVVGLVLLVWGLVRRVGNRIGSRT